jgi:prephenate dehydrogenase
MPRLAIIGLGLIGGSLGLALKRAGLKNLEIAGWDAEWGVGPRAKKLGVIDQDARDVPTAIADASIVVVATPISEVTKVFELIAPMLEAGAIVTDTASTKREIVHAADRLLPDTVSFVGGHPIAGKEHSGVDAADASLFEGRSWAVTPSLHADEDAIKAVDSMIAATGARPVLIDAAEHDSYMAAISHLPLVVSTALFSLARTSSAWEDLGLLAGPGFRDLTRLASTDPQLSRDICDTNGDNLVHWLDRMIEELRRARDLIAGGESEQLTEIFKNVQEARNLFIDAPPGREPPRAEGNRLSAGEQMLSFMVGEYAVRRVKEIEKGARDRAEGR